MADTVAKQFNPPDSLGPNPFPVDDDRHVQWETFSSDAIGGLSRLISSLRELSEVTDAESYEDWRRRYIELSPPADYESAWVAHMVDSDQARWIIGRFTRLVDKAFEVFIHGPGDLVHGKQIVQCFADAMLATMGTAVSDEVFARVVRWREWWRPTRAKLRLYHTNLRQAGRNRAIAESAASSDPAAEEADWIRIQRADWRDDADYSLRPPPILLLVKSARLDAIMTLRREAADSVLRTLPQTAQDLELCLWPAFSTYAEFVFDKTAEAKLSAGGRGCRSTPYVRWLRSKCLPAVVEDICRPIIGQFPITLHHAVEIIGDGQSRELDSTRQAIWGMLTEVIGGPFTENLKKRLTVLLIGRSLRWEARVVAQAAPAATVRESKRKSVAGAQNVSPPQEDSAVNARSPKRGAPEKPQTAMIFRAWVGMAKPRLTSSVKDKIAKKIFPQEFQKAQSNQSDRKKLRDRIQSAIRRHSAREPAT